MSASVTEKVSITHDLGLHLRAAGALVQLASRSECDITIKKGSLTANGKSIMSVLSLAAPCGTELEITVTGENPDSTLESLVNLVKAGFNL